MILIKNTQRKIKFNVNNIKNQVSHILTLVEHPDFDVNFWFTTNKTIRKFNKKFRKKDKPTDIISFPFYPELKPGEKIKPKLKDDKNLGDIIISLEFCQKDSIKLNIPFEKYLLRIIVHGIVHLIGYDHITEAQYKKMHKFEQKILKTIGITVL